MEEVALLSTIECNCDGQKTITQLNATDSELQQKQMIAKAKQSDTNLVEQIRAEHEAESASVISDKKYEIYQLNTAELAAQKKEYKENETSYHEEALLTMK